LVVSLFGGAGALDWLNQQRRWLQQALATIPLIMLYRSTPNCERKAGLVWP